MNFLDAHRNLISAPANERRADPNFMLINQYQSDDNEDYENEEFAFGDQDERFDYGEDDEQFAYGDDDQEFAYGDDHEQFAPLGDDYSNGDFEYDDENLPYSDVFDEDAEYAGPEYAQGEEGFGYFTRNY